MPERPKSLPACNECRYWVETGINNGQCRRRPPVIGPKNQGCKWPITPANAWCGEGVSKKLDELEDLCRKAFMPTPTKETP